MEQFGQFIINHWQLWLTLAVIIILIFFNETFSQKQQAIELTPEAAINKMNHENAVVIDIRDPEQFAKGHIIDAMLANNLSFEQKKMDKYKKKIIILTCTRGVHSASLAAKLAAQGFESVYVLRGGMEAWQKASLPLVK
jgi:rhodanese-related sulfurtransferase